MRLNAMFLGMVAWTAAVGVPALYAAAICCAYMRHDHRVDLRELMDSMNNVPIVLWIYAIAMTMLGGVLVAIGFTRPRPVDDLSEI